VLIPVPCASSCISFAGISLDAHHSQAVPLPISSSVNHVSLHAADPDMPGIFYRSAGPDDAMLVLYG